MCGCYEGLLLPNRGAGSLPSYNTDTHLRLPSWFFVVLAAEVLLPRIMRAILVVKR